MLGNPFSVVAIDDFNARLSSWCINDESNYKGIKIHYLHTHYNLKHIINEPSHYIENSSSRIDLIFTFQTTYRDV